MFAVQADASSGGGPNDKSSELLLHNQLRSCTETEKRAHATQWCRKWNRTLTDEPTTDVSSVVILLFGKEKAPSSGPRVTLNIDEFSEFDMVTITPYGLLPPEI